MSHSSPPTALQYLIGMDSVSGVEHQATIHMIYSLIQSTKAKSDLATVNEI